MLKYFINIVLLLLLAAGCQKPTEAVLTNGQLTQITTSGAVQLVNSKGEPVLMIDGQEIDSDDIIDEPAQLKDLYMIPGQYLEIIAQSMDFEEFKEKIKDPLTIILENKIRYILMYNSAKKQFKDRLDESLDKAVESEMRRFYLQFGGDRAKADLAIEQKWIDIESYKKLIRKEILEQWYLSSQETSGGFITYRELKRQYDSMKDEFFAVTGMIEFRLIDIQPAKLKIPDPNMDRAQYSEELATEIFVRLKSGEDFAELATQYSSGPKKQFGGLWDPMNPESLAEPYDAIAKAAQNMNPGDISEPIKAGAHIFIVKLEDKRKAGYEPFENVQQQVRLALISKQNTSDALNKLEEYVDQQMKLDETNSFIDFCLEKIYRESTREEK
ncbi:MAG: peptidylprolyl isomerase [Sedimentisphaerales bacterium]